MLRTLTRGTVAAAAAALVLTGTGAASAATGADVDTAASETSAAAYELTGSASAVALTGDTTFSAKTVFGFAKPAGMQPTQGLGFKAGTYYITSDQGGGMSRMIGYTRSSTGAFTRVFDSGNIPAGHAQTVDVAGDTAYITATEVASTGVVAYSISQRQVVRRYSIPNLNSGAVAGIDRENKQIVVVRGGAGRPHVLRFYSLETGVLTKEVPIDVRDETQGIVAYGGKIMVLTTYDGLYNDPHGRTNHVTVYDYDGKKLKEVLLPTKEEAEGLTVDRGTGRLLYGAHQTDRVLEVVA